MKSVKNYYSFIVFLAFCGLLLVQAAAAQRLLSPQDKKIIADFEKAAQEYVELRERLEEKLPDLPKEATPEQIEAHKVAFQKSVQSARQTAKQGDLFNSAVTQIIRGLIKAQFKGQERTELRKTVLEADTKGVPLKINYPYPDSIELIEMPPALLLQLPQLPKQLRYRFVGRSLLLVDRENSLIVDYMTNALP
ncbi:MAG: hypothetical protein M3209_09120 [Acidobacteriota bacterium]|nr:hypothetical protein [Acidobacteriota bacterium]